MVSTGAQAVTGSGAGLVILDRDGVINEENEDYVRSVADWTPLPGSLEAIAALCRAGHRVVIASNQSAVGRGLVSVAELARIHEHMTHAIESAGGAVAGIYWCPHLPQDGCSCRKPQPGLLLKIAADFRVSLESVPFIGDKLSDVEAARAAGAIPVLVRSGYGTATAAALRESGVAVYDDLRSAVNALLGGQGKP